MGDGRKRPVTLLRQEGMSSDEVDRAVAEDRLALGLVDLLFADDRRHTVAQTARAAGVSEAFLRQYTAAAAIPVADGDTPVFGDADIDTYRAVRAALDADMPEAGLLRVARVVDTALTSVADALVDETVQPLLHAERSELEVALRVRSVVERLLPTLAPYLAGLARHHLRARLEHEQLRGLELASARIGRMRIFTAAFVYLVGFTALTERLSQEDLDSLLMRFGDVTGEVARTPVRRVKLVGDAALLVSTAGPLLLDALTSLRVRLADEGLPQARIGAAHGPALERAGDWYGRPVNGASRVPCRARPGSIVATGSAQRELGGTAGWRRLGDARLKGIDQPVALFESAHHVQEV